DKDLQQKVDKALVKLQENGTMKKLSEKYLGGDFTPREEEMKDEKD
ncbi:MAG: transporter substrate-binding domain-containing protein, partial [Lactococcus sp.]